MLILITTLTIYTEKREEFLNHLAPMIAASQAEAGCLKYEASQLLSNPNTFQFTEYWQDKTALEAHATSEHMATFKAQIANCLESRTPKEVFEAKLLEDI